MAASALLSLNTLPSPPPSSLSITDSKFVEITPSVVLPVRQPDFPDRTKIVERQQEEARVAEVHRKRNACTASGGTVVGDDGCEYPPPPVVSYTGSQQASVVTVIGTLTGSYGYALAGGNCINQVPVGLRGEGNPISWPATTQTPYIGGAALWFFNHTGRVVGLWSDGSIEVAHENVGGWGLTRFPRSAFRGFR